MCFAWTFEVNSMVSCFTLQSVKYSAMKQFEEGYIMSSTKQGDSKEEEERTEERRWREYLTQPKGRATLFTGPTTHVLLVAPEGGAIDSKALQNHLCSIVNCEINTTNVTESRDCKYDNKKQSIFWLRFSSSLLCTCQAHTCRVLNFSFDGRLRDHNGKH
jgi:hypothetical protein